MVPVRARETGFLGAVAVETNPARGGRETCLHTFVCWRTGEAGRLALGTANGQSAEEVQRFRDQGKFSRKMKHPAAGVNRQKCIERQGSHFRAYTFFLTA